ncbi:hypothetical protein AVEN_128301-1 [Araneus ventricosus]|uniref:Uncharacterized protein n=1 Tax=Araneus ventricosus TaxID=182803 RepID=A0A4Y2V537_ARAVE|nr:hypothetical protein AVEN_128301-1 [Araneus ventricosus]
MKMWISVQFSAISVCAKSGHWRACEQEQQARWVSFKVRSFHQYCRSAPNQSVDKLLVFMSSRIHVDTITEKYKKLDGCIVVCGFYTKIVDLYQIFDSIDQMGQPRAKPGPGP